jgi:hypothetical protein
MEDIIRHQHTFWENSLQRLKNLLENTEKSLNKIQIQNKNKMDNQNYSATIKVAASPGDVFAHINDVSKWWATPSFKGEFEGQSTKLNDEFIVRFGDAHYSKQKLVEFIPGKKVVWLVTDSLLNWIEKDKTEWTGTKMIFELTPDGDQTVLSFTHEGLVPEQECYAKCEQGWDMLIKANLPKSITEGKGSV